MNISIVLRTVGNLVLMLAAILVAPLVVSFYYGNNTSSLAFVYTIIITGFLGGLSKVLVRKREEEISMREGIAIVSFSWMICIFLGALPYWFSDVCTTYCDAVFETASGFTTTGSSIFTDVEIIPHGILFWRSFTNWLGGMGIIVVFVALLPAMGISGYQLFIAEVSGPTTGKIKPRIGETAKILWIIYLVFTAVETVLLFCGGMPIFDAVCHAFTTISTGGFSTKNTSIAHFNSLYIEIVVAVFMLFGGCNFSLFYLCFQRHFKKVRKNSELRFFTGLILLATIFITLILCFSQLDSTQNVVGDEYRNNFGHSLRGAFFQVITICSGTGYMTADYDAWPTVCRFLLILLMFIGACAGSTGGGIKGVRVLLLLKSSMRELIHVLRPRMVKHVKLNGMSVSEEIITESSVFFVVYLGIFGMCSLALMALKTDMVTAFSAVATCMANCGPGLAGVGPTSNFSEIPYASKWILSFCMLVGRLEIYSFILLFLPITWKR
ncbi:MAG: TrkH family potassium uptake protein [Candidatus Brocadiaceae bacterium]|nr:TrkH family potassium uptake protein [Candidatus Brocadiaceae bacterium]